MSPIVAHVRLAGLLMAPLLLLACSTTFETKKIDYKTASKSQVPTLEIPPDLTSPTRDDRYAVPDTGGGKGSATYSAYSAERSPAGAGSAEERRPAGGRQRAHRTRR
jgi:outer membrane protein assembly factor BamC